MQHTNNIKTVGLLALGLSGFASAGDSYSPIANTPVMQEEASSTGWCDGLKSIGKLYKNSENPLIQEFSVFGRLQYQGAWVNGEDENGDDFDDSYDEFRRVRIGAKGKFLQYFDFKANINLLSDGRPSGNDLDWGVENFDEALIGFDIKKAFGIDQLDKLHLSYGRHKFAISHEAVESSKNIVTVERSAISNKVYGSDRPTGFKLKAAQGPWSALLGIYSTEVNDKFIADWGGSVAYQASLGYQVSDELSLLADFAYNDGDVSGTAWGYKWATSLSAVYESGRFGLVTDFIYGDNGDVNDGQNVDRQDSFWGVVVIPHYWLVEDRLQAVARYQYQGSDGSEGIRLNSRYVRRNDDTGAAINSGRGDSHHSIYAGLNYYLCDNNAKFMAGVEYDSLDTPDGDVSATTFWLAFRTYF
ncbi:MAG: porin [Roseibacillus sp.]